MKLDFPGAEKFEVRHKELAALSHDLSIDDLDALIALARHYTSTHENPLLDAALKPEIHDPPDHLPSKTTKPKKERGALFPDNPEDMLALREQIITDEFMAWYTAKGWNYDLDAEWERFTLHAQEKHRRFNSFNLARSCRMAFQSWLRSPYAHVELSGHVNKEKPTHVDPQRNQAVLRARELKAEALRVGLTSEHHWMMLFRGLLTSENIDYESVKNYL